MYFCTGLDDHDNELLALEVLHRYVELLDKYFGNVSVCKFQEAKKCSPEDWVCIICNMLLVMASNVPLRAFKWFLNQGELVFIQKSICST